MPAVSLLLTIAIVWLVHRPATWALRAPSGRWFREVRLDPVPVGTDEVASCVSHKDRRAMDVAGGRLDVAVFDPRSGVLRPDQSPAEACADDLGSAGCGSRRATSTSTSIPGAEVPLAAGPNSSA